MVTVFDIRTASQDEKASLVEQRYNKPTTNTSGTATGSTGTEAFSKRFNEALKFTVPGTGGKKMNPINAAMAAFNPSGTVKLQGGAKYNAYEQEFMKDVRAGKYSASATPKTPTSTTSPGINAPPPDQPWQPSSLSGIQSQEEDPLKRYR